MACRSCEERRRMLAEAIAKGGAKGFIKAVPAVARHMVGKRATVKVVRRNAVSKEAGLAE